MPVDPAKSTLPAAIPGRQHHKPHPGGLLGAYNQCATCGLTTRDAKYCPYCGPELSHVGPESRCPHCTEVNNFAGAKFCAWCGKSLAPDPAAAPA